MATYRIRQCFQNSEVPLQTKCVFDLYDNLSRGHSEMKLVILLNLFNPVVDPLLVCRFFKFTHNGLPIFSSSKKVPFLFRMMLSRLILMSPSISWLLMAVNADMAMANRSLAS
ncbi:hypothetical protein GOODEAATRI_001611 [Goodea atripinnis]|uniref:Uncharacterized protein n=1 Tax=Goodea atripinnis TaxID=208336 RepID=A0ABV0P0S3_9TELE